MTPEEQMLSKYGKPDAIYQDKFCILWEIQKDFVWFPVSRIFINKDFKEKLFQSFTEVQRLGLEKEIKIFSGCLVVRQVRGKNSISAHSWGAAIDMNAQEDPMIITDLKNITPEMRLGKWSKEFVTAMKTSGIFFGGDFIYRPDPMHFSLLDM